MDDDLKQSVRNANKRHHESIDARVYDTNRSIFDPGRRGEVESVLADLAVPDGSFLDVGCGSGNVLELAEPYFGTRVGVDLAGNMVAAAGRKSSSNLLVVGDAQALPFASNSFDVVSMYALLHHFPAPEDFLREGLRVLKPGGYLYTDHDPNYYLVRFYYPLYRILHLGRSGFGDETGDLAEYYHTHRPGIDPEGLREFLREQGCPSVSLQYRRTGNPDLSTGKKVVRSILEVLSRVVDCPSFHTHFSLVARAPD